VDWGFDPLRRQTAQGPEAAGKYPRFAAASVLPGRGHARKRGGAARALLRLPEHRARLGGAVNREKTKRVALVRGDAGAGLGLERRRVPNRARAGYCIRLTPRHKARLALKARVRELLRRGGAPPLQELSAHLTPVRTGGVQYLRGGKASRAFREIRAYGELKGRILLTRRQRRHKRRVGWRRWSNEYLYAVLKLFWAGKLRPLPGAGAYP
jgi:RNA-directed DNA polymerase